MLVEIILSVTAVCIKETGLCLLPVIFMFRNQRERISASVSLVYLLCTLLLVIFRYQMTNWGNSPNMSELDNPLLGDERGDVWTIILISIHNLKSVLLPIWLCHDWSTGTSQIRSYDSL